MNKYQVVEVSYDNKTHWVVEPIIAPKLCFSNTKYISMNEAIIMCVRMNKPSPPPETRKIVYP